MRRLRRRIAHAARVIGAAVAIFALGVYGTHGLDPREMVAPCAGYTQCAQMSALSQDIPQTQTTDAVTPVVKEIHVRT